jgi:hypothetical protein
MLVIPFRHVQDFVDPAGVGKIRISVWRVHQIVKG